MPVDHHFLPLMTTSSPSRIAVACMLVASLDATSGSVMQNAERISTASRGLSQRSEEHTSELQSLMRISYAVFCLKTKKLTSDLLCSTTKQASTINSNQQ